MGVLDLLKEPLLLRMRVVVYAVLIVFSFVIFIGVAVMKDQFVAKCPLFSDIYNSKDGDMPSCNYPLATAIVAQLLYLIIRVATLVPLLVGRFTKDMFLFSDIMELLYEIFDCLGFLFTFVGACILSAGTYSACNDQNEVFCDHADWVGASEAAQTGAWISTFAWLLIAIVGFFTLKRAGKIPCLRGEAAARSAGSEQATAEERQTM